MSTAEGNIIQSTVNEGDIAVISTKDTGNSDLEGAVLLSPAGVADRLVRAQEDRQVLVGVISELTADMLCCATAFGVDPITELLLEVDSTIATHTPGVWVAEDVLAGYR